MAKSKQKTAKFNNDLYNIDFASHKEISKNKYEVRPFTATEMRIFLAIVYKVYEQGSRMVTIPMDELDKLTGYKMTNSVKRKEILRQAHYDLLHLSMREETENEDGFGFRGENIFQELEFTSEYIKCRVNENYEYLFNSLFRGNPKGYSKVFLDMMNELPYYAQMIALNLSCFIDTREWHVTLDEFRKRLRIPEKYDYHKIKGKILDPAMKELSKYFTHITYIKHIKKRKVTGLSFFFSGLSPDGRNEYERGEIPGGFTTEDIPF